MPSEYCYEYPTRIRKIVIPTSSNISGFFENGLPNLPGRFNSFRIPPSESTFREVKSERNTLVAKPRKIHRVIKRTCKSEFDSELDPIFIKHWPIVDIPPQGNVEDADFIDNNEDYSDLQHDPTKQSGDFSVGTTTHSSSDLLELSPLQQQDQTSFMGNSIFELAENAVSKVWVNPQYERVLKRKADEEGDSVDYKKRKAS